MMDRFKRSLQQMEVPVCPNCQVEMRWTESALMRADTIAHLFHCPNCYRTGQTSSKVQIVVVPPDALAGPSANVSGYVPRRALSPESS